MYGGYHKDMLDTLCQFFRTSSQFTTLKVTWLPPLSYPITQSYACLSDDVKYNHYNEMDVTTTVKS